MLLHKNKDLGVNFSKTLTICNSWKGVLVFASYLAKWFQESFLSLHKRWYWWVVTVRKKLGPWGNSFIVISLCYLWKKALKFLLFLSCYIFKESFIYILHKCWDWWDVIVRKKYEPKG